MRNLRILIVDPHHDGAESLATLLGLWGHETRIAADGRSALAELTAFEPDLVLADGTLGDMDGPELADRLLSTCEKAHPSILARMSVTSDRREGLNAAELVFDYHFGKPLNLAFLNKVLQFHRDRLGQPAEPFPRRNRHSTLPEGSR
jgi:CheY-like chemotaxis protein